MWHFQCVVWAGTLLTLVSCCCIQALAARTDAITTLMNRIKEIESKLSGVEERYRSGLTDKVDYGGQAGCVRKRGGKGLHGVYWPRQQLHQLVLCPAAHKSSWRDLAKSEHNYFDITGFSSSSGGYRRFYVNHKHGGCPGDIGWLSIKDSGNPCPWEAAHQYPTFVYSRSQTMINWQNVGDLRGFADVMAVWVKFRSSANLSQECMA